MPHARRGFTLIELSIVLVIIGLIVGGVLVGQDLIRAAAVRAQISQIEKYNTAVNTFRGKYGALPGDLNQSIATQFGFATRGPNPGQGDGNGVIEGNDGGNIDSNWQCTGETGLFWVDLSQAGLIDGTFTAATAQNDCNASPTSTPSLDAYFPKAKIGQDNRVYVWSGGVTLSDYASANNGLNYFGVNVIQAVNSDYPTPAPGLTVAQAYSIDNKIDDGKPLTGNVTAMIVHSWMGMNAPIYGNTASSTSCADGPPATGQTTAWEYSLSQSGGAGVNCALSFLFE